QRRRPRHASVGGSPADAAQFTDTRAGARPAGGGTMMKRLAPVAALALAGCAATAPQYYSLQTSGTDTPADARPVQSDYVISVQPVLIPQQVSRPQIVVGGLSGAEVVPLNVALWAGPLEAQIRDTLAAAL